MKLRIVILGLSITSSWGNGHATVYRGIVRELAKRGHSVLFLERDVPWYSANRDLSPSLSDDVCLYRSVADLKQRFTREIRSSDCTIIGSYVPDGREIGRWATELCGGVSAFYDIDTPVTLSRLGTGECDYLDAATIPAYSVYLSFTGGPVLKTIQKHYGSPMARAFPCCVDPEIYHPEPSAEKRFDLGYIGTHSDDRRSLLERLLLAPASARPGKRFVVAGPLYPETMRWPENVARIEHIAPTGHRAFYNAQRFTLNLTRAAMVRTGWSPSVRLFEAAACGTPILTDDWPGLDRFFRPGKEIVIVRTPEDVLRTLDETDPGKARRIAERARHRVLTEHTAARRAAQLETIIAEARDRARRARIA